MESVEFGVLHTTIPPPPPRRRLPTTIAPIMLKRDEVGSSREVGLVFHASMPQYSSKYTLTETLHLEGPNRKPSLNPKPSSAPNPLPDNLNPNQARDHFYLDVGSLVDVRLQSAHAETLYLLSSFLFTVAASFA